MAGEHLDIIRINNKNSENQRFYSLRVILSAPFYNFSYWDNEFMLWGGFGQVSWGGYGHC